MRQNPYDTRYFEKYAMLSLRYAYDPCWDSFVCGAGVESPDLQSEALDIGVGVAGRLHAFEQFMEDRQDIPVVVPDAPVLPVGDLGDDLKGELLTVE